MPNANQSLLIQFLEKNIFDIQIGTRSIHPVQISSHSDYYSTPDIMWKHIENAEKIT